MSEKWLHLNAQLESLTMFLGDHESMMGSHLNDFFCKELRFVENMETFCEMCREMAHLGCCFESTYGFTCHRYCRKIARQACNRAYTSKNGNTFLSIKKDHEISVMSSSIREMINSTGCPNVVDIGSGKGYLGQQLTQDSNCWVLGVEGSSSCSESAQNRQKQISKLNTSMNKPDRSLQETMFMKTITEEVDDETINDSALFVHAVKSNFCGDDGKRDCANHALLVGLHACGDLTARTLKLFVKETFFKGVQIVGCCYNLCTEGLISTDPISEVHAAESAYFPLSSNVKSKNFHLGKVARQLACQSPDKWRATKQDLQRSLLYRAILQKMVLDMNKDTDILSKVKFRKIGKRSASFADYMNAVYKYLDLSD